jgi:class 3 adenylate cyclase
MPLFMDVHRLPEEVTPDMVAQAHAADVKIQDLHKVCYQGYWYNSTARTVACLVEGPTREECERVHREAHGLVADEIIEVTAKSVEAFLGGGSLAPSGEALLPDGSLDSGLRVLMFTELDGLARVSNYLGDAAALGIVERHDRVARRSIPKYGGREVRHTGDGMMLSFALASSAVQCALEIQREYASQTKDSADVPALRIGIAAGEPVAQHQNLFGVAANSAQAICRSASPGEVLVSVVVRDLCAGKGLSFAPAAEVRLPGLDAPIEVASVRDPAGGTPPSAAPQPTSALQRLAAALGTRYVLERELGRGGMATVYLARDRRHDRAVAIKVLPPDLTAALGAERFLQEIRVAARLTHPNIVSLYDSGEAHGYLYYVMPHLEGETLRQLIHRERQLTVTRALEIARSVAAAIGHAHRQGVIHRDIKPENILVHEGQAMVMDFGIALALTQVEGDRLTEPGLSLGTPVYMSPEQAAGDRNVDARADIYSLGCVLYEMLLGDPPFSGSNVQALIARILTETPAPLSRLRSGVPEQLSRVVQRALSKVPADRFASASEFASALE